jgi:hypothetical protein
MALTLMQPKLRSYLYNLTADMFDNLKAREVFELLQTHPGFDGTDKALVQKVADYGKILALVYETLYQDVEMQDLEAEAARLQSKLVRQYVQIQKQAIVVELQDAENTKADQLLTRARELDELLRANQGGAIRGTEN